MIIHNPASTRSAQFLKLTQFFNLRKLVTMGFVGTDGYGPSSSWFETSHLQTWVKIRYCNKKCLLTLSISVMNISNALEIDLSATNWKKLTLEAPQVPIQPWQIRYSSPLPACIKTTNRLIYLKQTKKQENMFFNFLATPRQASLTNNYLDDFGFNCLSKTRNTNNPEF